MQSRSKIDRIILMRIGIYSPYLDTLGGGEKYMLSAASCLSKNNDVYLFWDDKQILQNLSDKFDIDLSKIQTSFNIFNPNVSLAERYIKSKKFEKILFLSDGSIPIVGCDLLLHFQFPVEWINGNSIFTKLKINRVKKIICNSMFTKEFIDRKFKVKSKVIYPPTYFSYQLPKINYSQKENVILHVGRYQRLNNNSSFKKQEFLIESFKKIYDKGYNNWQFNLVISYKDRDKQNIDLLKETARNYPINFIENALFKDLSKEYKNAKIYWHASGYGENIEINPERAEHFGITTVEAMMNGLVPVVIDCGGQKEIVENNKNGFLWKTQEDFIEKTISLIKDNSKIITLSKKAIGSSNKFISDNFCKDILSEFNKNES